MEPRNNNDGNDQDFTSKGRTSGDGLRQHEPDENDISEMDQQEGHLNHGTTGKDQGLFTNEEQTGTQRS